jgi:hypothetical protein
MVRLVTSEFNSAVQRLEDALSQKKDEWFFSLHGGSLPKSRYRQAFSSLSR